MVAVLFIRTKFWLRMRPLDVLIQKNHEATWTGTDQHPAPAQLATVEKSSEDQYFNPKSLITSGIGSTLFRCLPTKKNHPLMTCRCMGSARQCRTQPL